MGCGSSRVAPADPPSLPPPRQSVCCFWDVENCPVPQGIEPSDAVSALRKWVAQELRWPSTDPDFHIICAYNVFAKNNAFWNKLKRAGVEQLAAGNKQESADRELESRMRREARLLPAGEDSTCIILITSDMDFLPIVRELRGRVCVHWVYSNETLSSSTLRQLEEATRGARETSALTTWQHVLTFAADVDDEEADDDDKSDADGRTGSQKKRSRGKRKSPSKKAAVAPQTPQQQQQQQQQQAAPLTPSPPPPPDAARQQGVISHWDNAPNKQWGYVSVEGEAGVKRHFRITDVLDPVPQRVRLGMKVEFTPSVNPPHAKFPGKPIATFVGFLPEAEADPDGAITPPPPVSE